MRYIGNKTKLLNFIGSLLDDLGVQHGRALDAFAGTATVGSFLKSRGFAVEACDIMTFSYVFQRAYIVADEYPDFAGLAEDAAFQCARETREFRSTVQSRFAGQGDFFANVGAQRQPLEDVLVYLDSFLPPRASFITENYSAVEESSDGERMYFTRQNASRIDAIRHQLEDWKSGGMLHEDEFYILLATLIEAADAVANTTGVYAAYVKTWQSNAKKPLRMQVPQITANTNRKHAAHLGDVTTLVDGLGALDLLYLDPPYNTRQYSAYYHVPELIAEGWFDTTPELRGKTGLIEDGHKKSQWSTKEGCVPALDRLLRNADAEHVVMSYNNEGIIPESEIERVFSTVGCAETYARFSKDYKRYRSDGDSDSRQYSGDKVTEYLYYVRLK